jgi:hypothetical protein
MLAPWVTFKQEARFSQIHVKGEANFGSAQFEGWADFYNAKIDGPAFFRIDRSKNEKEGFDNDNFIKNPIRFCRGVRFRFANFGDELNFHGADFSVGEFRSPKSGNPADDPCNIDIAKKTLTEDRRVDKPVIDFTYVHCTRVVFFCDPDQPKNGKKCTFSSTYQDFNGIPKGPNFNKISVSNDDERKEKVQQFQSEFETNKEECPVLIFNLTSSPDKWTIALSMIRENLRVY